MEEYVFPMIKKSTPVPAEVENSFGTAKANMKSVVVRVVEGESTVPAECTPLGICNVQLPPYLPKGSPVQLTYRYDENQVLEVRVDAYGNQSVVTISRNLGLNEAEMEEASADLMRVNVE
jgi:molecular chaperone DnaK